MKIITMFYGQASYAVSMLMLVYIAIGLYFEERDLLKHFGDTYRQCKQRVPALLPFPKKGNSRACTLSLVQTRNEHVL